MAVDDAALRKLDEVARRVAMYRKAWHAARPEQANQAYERYRAEEEYLARLLDDILSGARDGVRQSYHAYQSASDRLLGASNEGWE